MFMYIILSTFSRKYKKKMDGFELRVRIRVRIRIRIRIGNERKTELIIKIPLLYILYMCLLLI